MKYNLRNKKKPRINKGILSPPVEDLKSLIEIGMSDEIYSNINTKILREILPQLILLDRMIGMENLKKTIFYQIIYYIQRLDWNSPHEYLHTVLLGPPGCGKTTIAQIIGELYSNLGILSNKKIFKIVKREDLVAEYLGQTAIKTKKLLNKCKGGVLFIDEAYALGPGQKDKDSFSKEAIDTINAFLSENKDFCCIIAGYETEIKKCFFSVNQGLERRFPWIHKIDNYTSLELAQILKKMIREINWESNQNIKELSKIIEGNMELFKNSGGDIENFLTKCKISHAKRVFNLDIKHKFILTEDDFKNGLLLLKENNKNNIVVDNPPDLMYI